MENSWQRKCGSMWQSTVAPVASSSQEQQNEVKNLKFSPHFLFAFCFWVIECVGPSAAEL